jgi:hypothetical protein
MRPLWVALLVACLLHVPALPARFTSWLRYLFWNQPSESDEADPQAEVILPIEVDLFDEAKAAEEASADPDDEEEDEADEAEPPAPPPLTSDDDDLDNAFEEEPDAGAPTKPPPVVADAGVPETPDAGPEPETDAGAPDAGPEEVAQNDDRPDMDRLAEGALRAEEPNVNLYVACDVLRKRDLAKVFGKVLESIPQWNDLLGGTGLHPMEHFDRLLISGPQLRNPRWIVVTLKYNITSPRMKRAVDTVVSRSKPAGHWLEDYDLPVAAIGAKAERYVAMVPDRQLLVIVPEEGQELLARVDALDPFQKAGQEGIVIDLAKPQNAFKNGPFEIPASIERLRVRFTLQGAEDYLVEVEAVDASPEQAAVDMTELADQIESKRVFPPIIGYEIVGEPTFSVEGSTIRGRASVSKKQLEVILDFAGKAAVAQAKAAADAAKKKKAADEEKRKKREKKLAERRKKILEARRKKAGQMKLRPPGSITPGIVTPPAVSPAPSTAPSAAPPPPAEAPPPAPISPATENP